MTPDVEVLSAYRQARRRAARIPTFWLCRRVRRARQHFDPLDRVRLARLAAARDELHRRGVQAPTP